MSKVIKSAKSICECLDLRLCLELIAAGLVYLVAPLLIVAPFAALIFSM